MQLIFIKKNFSDLLHIFYLSWRYTAYKES